MRASEDRLSRFPEAVLHHILSLLPTEDLVKKTVLIPGFRCHWPNVHTIALHLPINGCLYELRRDKVNRYEKFWNLVRNFLVLHERPTLYKFKLSIPFRLLGDDAPDSATDRNKRTANDIDACVLFAVKKNVGVLDLDLDLVFCFRGEDLYEIPSAVFRVSSLLELKLASCRIHPKGEISMNSLKASSLDGISLTDDVLDVILHGCPLLENLSFSHCHELSKLKIVNPHTKTLKLDHQCLHVSCPYVLSLSFTMPYIFKQWDSFDFINVSSLEVVTISAETPPKYRFFVEKLIEKLQGIKIMKLCGFSSKVLIHWDEGYMTFPSFKWKSVSLILSLTNWHISGFSRFLANSPYLETLALEINNKISPGVEKYSDSMNATFPCLETHLKTITVSCLTTESPAFQPVEFLLKNATMLEEMVISIHEATICLKLPSNC